MTELKPLATIDEAWAENGRLWAESSRLRAESRRLWTESYRLWAESDRLRAESGRLWDEADQILVVTAQALYGKDVAIDWIKRTASPKKGERP